MKPTGIRIFEFIPEQNSFVKFIEIIFVNEKYGKELYLTLIDDAYSALLSKTEYKFEFLYGNSWNPESKEMFKRLAKDDIDFDYVVM